MAVTTDEGLISLITQLEQTLQVVQGADELHEKIVNAPFDHPVETTLLFLGFICLFIADEAEQIVRLVGASDTEHYRMSINGYKFDAAKYHIRLNDDANSIAKAIKSGKPESTTDWGTLSRPKASTDAARLNQANSGIAYSIVYPLAGKIRGALMYNYFQYQDAIGNQQREFMDRYTEVVSVRLGLQG